MLKSFFLELHNQLFSGPLLINSNGKTYSRRKNHKSRKSHFEHLSYKHFLGHELIAASNYESKYEIAP